MPNPQAVETKPSQRGNGTSPANPAVGMPQPLGTSLHATPTLGLLLNDRTFMNSQTMRFKNCAENKLLQRPSLMPRVAAPITLRGTGFHLWRYWEAPGRHGYKSKRAKRPCCWIRRKPPSTRETVLSTHNAQARYRAGLMQSRW